MNTGIWLIRREFWENRAIWMIPAVIGALLIMASLFGGYQVLGGVDLATLRAVVQGGALDGMVQRDVRAVAFGKAFGFDECGHGDSHSSGGWTARGGGAGWVTAGVWANSSCAEKPSR